MMLTSKLPQAEPSAGILPSPSGDTIDAEKSIFSGLFSSMMDGQVATESDSLRQVDQLGSHEAILNSESLLGVIAPYDASIDGVVKDVVTQLESLSSSGLMKDEAISLGIEEVPGEKATLGLEQASLQDPVQAVSVETEQVPLDLNPVLSAESGLTGVSSFSEKPSPIAVDVEVGEEALSILEDEILPPPVMPASISFGAEAETQGNTVLNQSANRPNQRLDLASPNANLNMNEAVEGEDVEWTVTQQRLAMQGDSSVQAEAVSVNVLNQNSRSTLNQGATSWGTQSLEGQSSQGLGQQTSFSGQSSQQGSSQYAQQQSMFFAQQGSQASQESKQLSLEQQMAVKTMNDAMAKSEGKELLGGAEIASLDRKSNLPIGLQSINVPLKHPQWGQALGQRIVFMSNNSLQQAQITLNPQSLGQIQVTLQLDKDQKMHINLAAQNGMTRESMENALPRLREMMEQAGVQLGSVDISDQKQFSESGDAHEYHEKNTSKHTLVEEGKVEEQPLLMTGSTDNIIDYYA